MCQNHSAFYPVIAHQPIRCWLSGAGHRTDSHNRHALANAHSHTHTCPNFEDELIYTVDVRPGEPVVLHLWAALELKRPFSLVLDVNR